MTEVDHKAITAQIKARHEGLCSERKLAEQKSRQERIQYLSQIALRFQEACLAALNGGSDTVQWSTELEDELLEYLEKECQLLPDLYRIWDGFYVYKFSVKE
jgi:hypothetical protein